MPSQQQHQQQQQPPPNTAQVKPGSKQQSAATTKRAVVQQQNLSSNSTPKGKKVAIVQPQHIQQQHLYQVQIPPQQVIQQQRIQQQQPMVVFDNRKRSVEAQFYQQQATQQAAQQQQQMQIHSKSTKVSPQRLSTAPYNQSQKNVVHQQQIQQQQQQQHYSGTASMRVVSQPVGGGAGEQYGQSHMNTLQFYNFDMDGITPALVSHTTGAHVPLKATTLPKKDAQMFTASQQPLQQATDDMNMDASMHQSFINLIYPSKSKKLMSNETPQVQPTHGGHHQKSKSLYVGGNVVQNFVKPVAHQLAPKGVAPTLGNSVGGVQKIQHSSYKKQSSIFNYSQRFKELLNETMGDTDQQLVPHQQQHRGQHIFSQQHSPSANSGHIMVNFNDITYQQQRQQQQQQQKGTFDRPLVSQSHQPPGQQQQQQQQYLSLTEQAMLARQAEIHKTIDYPKTQTTTLHNTPNTNPATKGSTGGHKVNKAMLDKQNLLMASGGSLHQRKPSHPVTNNFMLELLQGPPIHQQPTHLVSSSFGGTNHHQIDLSTRPQQQTSTIDHSHRGQQQQQQQQQLSQYQQLQPVREKKQHQPTQSKIKQQPPAQAIHPHQQHHQRSASDYIQQHYQNQESKLIRFLNSESYDNSGASQRQNQLLQQEDIIESFENLDCTTITHSGQVNLNTGALESSNRGAASSFVHPQQQFSQMLYDGGQTSQQLSHRQQHSNANMNNQDKLSAVQSSQTIYHHRKMSLPQPPSSSSSTQTLQVKKSPSKTSTNQQQQHVQKIIVGGGAFQQQPMIVDPVSYQKVSQKRKSSPQAAQQQQPVPQQQNYINSSKVISQKGVQMLIKTSSVPQQQQYVGSMRGSQVSSPSNKQSQQQIVGIHTSSTTSIGGGQQPLPQQFNPLPTHNRSNSDLLKVAQNSQKQKQSQQQMYVAQVIGRPNPAINTQHAIVMAGGQVQPKAKSELTTPRQQAKAMKKTNGGSTTPANVSIDLAKTTQQQQTQRTATSGIITKNGSSNNLAQQQQQIQRKDQQPAANQTNTPRIKSPNKAAHNYPQPTTKAPQIEAKPSAQQFQAAVKRYSVQNSPRITQKSQQQQVAQQQQQNQQQQQYNLNQQYQIFQQVMAKQQLQKSHHNKTEAVSPSNGSSMNKQGLRGSIITASKSGLLDGAEGEDQAKAGHKRGASETEYLLSQIRNNINTLKAYQQPGYEPQDMIPPQQVATKPKGPIIETGDSRYKQLVIEDSHGSYQNLPTDPNMSPYSKDLNKLQKMIKINFRKFNEPPATTSEFYRIGRVLGRGAFGKVNLAAHKLSEQLVAIKSINKEFLRSSKHKKEEKAEAPDNLEHPEKKKVMQEFAILKQSNHQSVVRLYDSFETNKHICFVMELCAGGDLLTYVRKRRKLSEEVAKYFFKQLIEGLAYLHHSKLIVHRDIKLDNILLDANGKIKIADFGVSRQVQTEVERMSEQCGTPAYIAPEILKDKGYEGFKVDVWSAGVCLYAMLIGTVPFKAASMQELHHLIINGKYDINNPNSNCQKDGSTAQAAQQQQPPVKLSEHAQNLIHSLLQVDPRKRLSAVEVLSHPWLKDSKDELDIFTQKEKDVIHKEYLSKNIDRAINQKANKEAFNLNSTGQHNFNEETEVIFTEHNLDTRTNVGSLLKNASTKSIILAPFNSTVSEMNGEEESKTPYVWPEEIRKMIVPKRVLKFAPKVKDLDRQYEHNNNADLDNGVYNNVGNEDDPANRSKSQESLLSSQDSLQKSFKETELSSDDEKAEQQLEEARRKQKAQQQSELQEFEKQIKLKYVRYQEPVEVIDVELVNAIATRLASGVYPRDYLIKTLSAKEMNYATATYHLLLKKQHQIAKHAQQS